MSDRFYVNSKGVYVPSGTTVLPKPYLARWAANCAVDYISAMTGVCFLPPGTLEKELNLARTAFEQESKLAAGFGTFIHWMCEQTLKHGVMTVVPDTWAVPDETPWELTVDVDLTKSFMDGLSKWIRKHNVKVVAQEHEVVTDYYGGRLDLVCELDGVVTLVDFKTSSGGGYYPEYKYQLAGYRQAYNRKIWQAAAQYAVEAECGLSKPYSLTKISREYFNAHTIQRHGILKFNKKTGKVNYKDFTRYQATRPCKTGERINGKVPTEKYTRNYETDRATFNGLVKFWWLTQRGVEI